MNNRIPAGRTCERREGKDCPLFYTNDYRCHLFEKECPLDTTGRAQRLLECIKEWPHGGKIVVEVKNAQKAND
jgi:hypothetical protein